VGDALGVLVGSDPVGDAIEHGVLGIGAVAGEEDAVVGVFDDDAELARAVSRDGHEGDVAGVGQGQARVEWAERHGREVDRCGIEPGGQAPVGVPAQAASEPCRVLEFGPGDDDLGVAEVVQATGVVGVQVREHDAADVAGVDAEALRLRADLLLRLDALANREAKERLPSREVARLSAAGGLARIDDDHALWVLDREGIDR